MTGLIGSRRGRKGGYERIREPKRVSLAEVLRLIDGPLAPLPGHPVATLFVTFPFVARGLIPGPGLGFHQAP